MTDRGLRVPPEPSSARTARDYVQQLATARFSERIDEIVLLVSELVTNAILHAHTDITLRVEQGPGRLTIGVTDGSPVAPAPRNYSAEAMTGRGLELVSMLADNWGVDPGPDGKTVWFEIHANKAA